MIACSVLANIQLNRICITSTMTDKCLALLKLTTDAFWVVVKWILFPLCFSVPFKVISSGDLRYMLY